MQMKESGKLLVADNDPGIAAELPSVLESYGYTVIVARDGREALELAREQRPDLIVLDIRMPGLNGRDVLQELREQGDLTPVIMLTEIGEPSETRACLNLGADDYVHKRYHAGVLVARIKAVLRRAGPGQILQQARVLVADGLVVDRYAREVRVDGKPAKITERPFRVLEHLMLNAGYFIERETLLERVWGQAGSDYWDRVVDKQVSDLRQTLGDDPYAPRFIETRRDVGYRFKKKVEAQT